MRLYTHQRDGMVGIYDLASLIVRLHPSTAAATTMSVFSFKNLDRVWGLNRHITMLMIECWIKQAGPKSYLLDIKTSYDHGYNHGDLSQVADEDRAELRDLVGHMLAAGFDRSLPLDTSTRERVRRSIADFADLLNDDLYGTRFYQPPET